MGSKLLFRKRLEAANCWGGLGTRLVLKVERVDQANGRMQFDVYIPESWANQFCEALEAYSRRKRFRWHYRLRVPCIVRVGRGVSSTAKYTRHNLDHHRAAKPRGGAAGSPALQIATYNGNGLRPKKMEVRAFLQETKSDMRVPGYRCLASTGNNIRSERGIALLVFDKFSCIPVGRSSPYWVFARIYGATLTTAVIMGKMYIPHCHRNEALTKLPIVVASLRNSYPEDPIILMGEWNSDIHNIQGEVNHWPTPMRVVPNKGNQATHNQGCTIDHIAYSGVLTEPGIPMEAEFLSGISKCGVLEILPVGEASFVDTL